MGLNANIARLTDRAVSPFITSKQLLDARLQLVEPSLAAFATSRLLLNELHQIEDGFEVCLLAITTQDLRHLYLRAHGRQQGVSSSFCLASRLSVSASFSAFAIAASARSTGRGKATEVTTRVFSARASSALALSILPLSMSPAQRIDELPPETAAAPAAGNG